MTVIKCEAGILERYALYLSIMKNPVMQALLNDPYTYRMYYLDTSDGYVQTAVNTFLMSQYGTLAEDIFSNIQQKQHWNPAGEIITFSLGEGVNPADVAELRVYYRVAGDSYTTANSEVLQVQDDGSYILLLTGLTPETTYQYLIVLTKTTGEVYMSAEHGFRAMHDTDGDGMCDGEEDYGWKVYVDLNGDGDTDDSYERFQVSPLRDIYDSDGDGLNDAQEKALRTNPNYYDTDWDGLTDKDEANLYGTNPLEVDTDMDKLWDGDEIQEGRNPIVYEKEWLFMVYMDGDNNLEKAAINNLNEIEEVGSSTLINIVVQLDRNPDYDSSNGNWVGTRRYYVTKDNDPNIINSQLVQDLGEVDMGNSNSLVDFVDWATTNYPTANTYALILWDHGGGWDGICWDETSDNDHLTMAELKQAMNRIKTNIGEKLDIIGFDACMMQMVEVGYQIRGTADIIIGSEELIPWTGWPYNYILSNLTVNSQMDVERFVVPSLITSYVTSYDNGGGKNQTVTLSALRVDDGLSSAINNFALALINGLNSSDGETIKTEIANARANTEFFDWYTTEDNPAAVDKYDLYDFAELIQRFLDPDTSEPSESIKDKAMQLKMIVEDQTIEEQHLSDHPDSHGLSIYFPNSAYYSNSYENLDFSTNTHWDEFLRLCYSKGVIQ